MGSFPIAPDQDRTGLIYRFHAGYRFRFAGDSAKNDGIQAEMDIGYQSGRIFNGRLSFETGSTIDLFGETEHLGAYVQANFHPKERWVLALRGMGGGVSDDQESPSPSKDSDDFGGIFEFSFMTFYQFDKNLSVGTRLGYNLQHFGKDGGDQGTQHGLSTLLNLAYYF